MFIQYIFFVSLFINKAFSDEYMPVNRIVNSRSATGNQFPYQVSISISSIWGVPFLISHKPICSGSIIHPKWILTSAYCIYNLKKTDRILVQAATIFTDDVIEPNQQNRYVSRTFIHPNYPGNDAHHDIALLELYEPLEFNNFVKAVNLPAQEVVYLGEGIVAGWGSTTSNHPIELSKLLQYVNVPIIEYQQCNEIMSKHNIPIQVYSEQICTGEGKEHSALCAGDSGAPLVTKDKLDGYHVQIGIASWGLFPCGNNEIGSVYTRVSCYIDWIDDIVIDNDKTDFTINN